jgi:predicted enzyme related to lactoylglutathione lyase
MTTPRGKFIWYDVMTTDTKAAAKFCSDVIGWKAQEHPMADGGSYTIFSSGTILRARGVDAQQIFMTATLMCLIWLAALTMLVRQAQFTDFAANKAPVMSGQSLAFLPTFQR